MRVRKLFWTLYSVVLLVRITEGDTFIGCMVDIDGPYLNETAVNTPTVAVIRASESQPAVFYCSYTCHEVQDLTDPQNRLYNFRLYVNVLDEYLGPEQERFLPYGTRSCEDYNFTITTTLIGEECSQTSGSNMTTFQAQIYVTSDTPTLVAKCAIEYRSTASHPRICYSSPTFAIIPNETVSCPTIPLCLTTTDEEPTSTPAIKFLNGTENNISPVVFGPIVGLLGILLAIETAILIILLIVCLFYKCKKHKPQAVSHPVMFMNGETSVEAGSSKDNKTMCAIPMKTHDIPNLVQDDDSAVCTVSTISDPANDRDNNNNYEQSR